MAMELLEGRPLNHLIGGLPLPVERVVAIGEDVADALAAAHARGIIHRDIKPANIFAIGDGRAKVLDFGLAKLLTQVNGASTNTAETLATQDVTAFGATLGTCSYMSPEQALGQELDARTDLFSFGVTLYESATGMQPFRGKTAAEIYDAILHRDPTLALQLNPKIPLKLLEIMGKCLEKDPEMRYQSASEIRTDLRRLKRQTNPGSSATALDEAGPSQSAKAKVGGSSHRPGDGAASGRRDWVVAAGPFQGRCCRPNRRRTGRSRHPFPGCASIEEPVGGSQPGILR